MAYYAHRRMLQTRASVEPSRLESRLWGIPLGWIPFVLPAAKTAIAFGVCMLLDTPAVSSPAWLCLFARLGSRLVRTASGPDQWGGFVSPLACTAPGILYAREPESIGIPLAASLFRPRVAHVL